MTATGLATRELVEEPSAKTADRLAGLEDCTQTLIALRSAPLRHATRPEASTKPQVTVPMGLGIGNLERTPIAAGTLSVNIHHIPLHALDITESSFDEYCDFAPHCLRWTGRAPRAEQIRAARYAGLAFGYPLDEMWGGALCITSATASSWLAHSYLLMSSEVVSQSVAQWAARLREQISRLGADPLASARAELARMPASTQRERAEALLREITTALGHAQDPPGGMQALLTDDEAILLEWFAPHRRLGFSIERDPADSGWFLVSDSTLGDVMMSGAMSHPDLKRLIDMFFHLDTSRP